MRSYGCTYFVEIQLVHFKIPTEAGYCRLLRTYIVWVRAFFCFFEKQQAPLISSEISMSVLLNQEVGVFAFFQEYIFIISDGHNKPFRAKAITIINNFKTALFLKRYR